MGENLSSGSFLIHIEECTEKMFIQDAFIHRILCASFLGGGDGAGTSQTLLSMRTVLMLAIICRTGWLSLNPRCHLNTS